MLMISRDDISVFWNITFLTDSISGLSDMREGDMNPPNFNRSVNPISTKGADYTHHIKLALPFGFLDLPPGLHRCKNLNF